VTLSAPSSSTVSADYATVATGALTTGEGGTVSISPGYPINPYPFTINVPSGFGPISNLKVRLHQFSHAYPGDLDILLVSPSGQSVVLMSDAGGGNAASNLAFTFDDNGASLGTGALSTGTYKPTNIEDNEGGDTYASPAPAGPYGTTLSAFNGTDPTGAWRLYVSDDFPALDGGTIRGWSLQLTPSLEDFITAAGTLTFPPGTTSQSINIAIVGDTRVEPNETFQVQLSNPENVSFGLATGFATILNDDAIPSITSQPSSPPIQAGRSATLSVVASGSGLSYQWYVGSSGTTTSPISGATSSSYTTPALFSTTSYWVQVTNVSGSANSSTATVTVNPRKQGGQITSN
jgi:subtilisin-like proprotein convertase family protein